MKFFLNMVNAEIPSCLPYSIMLLNKILYFLKKCITKHYLKAFHNKAVHYLACTNRTMTIIFVINNTKK